MIVLFFVKFLNHVSLSSISSPTELKAVDGLSHNVCLYVKLCSVLNNKSIHASDLGLSVKSNGA